jgi:hypothetical protein
MNGTTVTGQSYNLTDPWATPICGDDIRIHLGGIRRFNGTGLTVLAHSLLVARIYQGPNPALAACHDFCEAFVGDLSPVQYEQAPLLKHCEELWLKRIAAGLGVLLNDREGVDHADRLAAAVEACHLGLPAWERMNPLIRGAAQLLLSQPWLPPYMDYLERAPAHELWGDLVGRYFPRHRVGFCLPRKGDA